MRKKGTPPTKYLLQVNPRGLNYYSIDEWSYLWSGSITGWLEVGDKRLKRRQLLSTSWGWLVDHQFIDVLHGGKFDKRKNIWISI